MFFNNIAMRTRQFEVINRPNIPPPVPVPLPIIGNHDGSTFQNPAIVKMEPKQKKKKDIDPDEINKDEIYQTIITKKPPINMVRKLLKKYITEEDNESDEEEF